MRSANATQARAEGSMADWSLLPADLVNRIAECLLSTNNLDWYMDLRAVCHNWRSATANPRASLGEPRFWPRSWVALDDARRACRRGDDDTLLFLNTVTGRFLRRRTPIVGAGYYLVSTTPGGFVILADINPPHAVRVLNPLTGSMTRFMAPKPEEIYLAAAVVSGSANPFTLVMTCEKSNKVYWADPESKVFASDTCCHRPSGLLPLLAGLYASGGRKHASLAAVDAVWSSAGLEDQPYVVLYAGGDTLLVGLEEDGHRVQVFKKAASDEGEGKGVLKQVTSIGNHALFVSDHRCLFVDADKLPSVEANCVYYLNEGDNIFTQGLYMYGLDTGRAERIAAYVVENELNIGPLSLVQLLVKYTVHVPCDDQLWESTRLPFPPHFEQYLLALAAAGQISIQPRR